jgi:hypothetical protein
MADPDFDVAWRALADSDARLEAPSRVRDTVMAAWDEASTAALPPPRRYRHIWRHLWPAAAALAAAALLLATGLTLLRDRTQRHDRTPASPAVAVNTPEVAPNRAANPPTDTHVRLEPQRPARAAATPRRTARARTGAATPLLRLAADPMFEAEPLQLVRLRMPRANLEMFGVALLEPDTSGLVDVDVLIGGDGLPRDIRRIRPVLDGPGGIQ